MWGKYTRDFKIQLVSNKPATKDEFVAFQQARVKCGKKLITKDYCDLKVKSMNRYKNTQRRPEDIQKRIKDRLYHKVMMNGDISGMNLLIEKRKVLTEIQ